MKLVFKTMGWATISGVIFFISALANSCSLNAAIFATLIATASKTPAYPLWELVFERFIWRKKKNLEPCYVI